ncbi:hypothetical protein [Acinetobacter sp. YH12239]|uniref:hypothetical protein n=1 Tax=Acinetobacter sp. YH12239 TaxID=2601166 RepID=UPI0015D2CFED|nr:hypothetical protein [Acinetobacter sp. YH12239]
MSQSKHQTFLKKSLAIAVATFAVSTAQAATEKDEIQKLRQEVEALKEVDQEI